MNALGRILSGLEGRSLAEPSGSVIASLSDGVTSSGRFVSIRGSLHLVPVFSVVSLISSSVGSLPLMVYRRLDAGDRERATNHRTWSMLHDQFNDELSADEGWEMTLAHLLLWGNAFHYKLRDNALDLVDGLWPIQPSRVQVTRLSNGEKRFILDGDLSSAYTEADILHYRGLSLDGLVGLSPVQEAREALGLAQSQQEFQGKFLDAGGKPGVLLLHPQRLTPEAARRMERSFDNAAPGSSKVLEEGMKAEKWTMPLEDAQFLESMQFSDLRIAQMFNLPPHFLGAKTGDSLTYANTEQQGIDFVTYTLRRWLVRIEKALRRDPSIFVQGDRFFAEFLTDALQRADIKTRYEAYKLGVEGGWLGVDEIRERENLPHRDDLMPAPPDMPPPASPSD